jgi:hypothetical protein
MGNRGIPYLPRFPRPLFSPQTKSSKTSVCFSNSKKATAKKNDSAPTQTGVLGDENQHQETVSDTQTMFDKLGK